MSASRHLKALLFPQWKTSNSERDRRIALANRFGIAMLCAIFFFVAFFAYYRPYLLASYLLALGFVILLSLAVLKKSERATTPLNIMLFTTLLVLSLIEYYLGGTVESNLSWFLLIPMLSVFLAGVRAGLVWTAVTCAIQGLFFYWKNTDYPFPDLP